MYHLRLTVHTPLAIPGYFQTIPETRQSHFTGVTFESGGTTPGRQTGQITIISLPTTLQHDTSINII